MSDAPKEIESPKEIDALLQDLSEPSKGIVRLVRRFNASQERVFNAFAKADHAAAWMGPEGLTCDVSEYDARPGGRYSLSMNNPSTGDSYHLSGEFREVDPFDRLSYTWNWATDEPEHETLVTLEFRSIGDMTELTLTHDRHRAEDVAANHKMGWTSSIRDLHRFLAT
ncbi:MAG: SRPBCC domain-containing protein [Pseudomonadota bacterium]